MTSLLHRTDTFVTVHNKCSTNPPSTSVHFAARVRRTLIVFLSRSSPFFLTSFFIQPHKQKSNRGIGEGARQIQTSVHIRLFSQNGRYYHPFTPKILTFPAESFCITVFLNHAVYWKAQWSHIQDQTAKL